MVLDGLEPTAKASALRRLLGNIRSIINIIRYADDFVVIGDSKQLLESKVKPAIESFLKQCGLKLTEAKTNIANIDNGFDFLSQNVRKYKGKLLIKPSADSIRSVLSNINQIIRKYRGMAAQVLIGALNPILRGWVNYHRHVVAKRALSVVINHLYRQFWRWMRQTAMELNGLRNQYKKYCMIYVGEDATFFITEPIELEGDGRPNLIMFDGLQGFAFDYDLLIDGKWSDLTVQFEFIKKSNGYYAVILHDIHVL